MKNLNPLYEQFFDPNYYTGNNTTFPGVTNAVFPGALPNYSSTTTLPPPQQPPAPYAPQPTVGSSTSTPPATTGGSSTPPAKNSNPGLGLGTMYAASMVSGLGTKLGKDALAVRKIIQKYPEPKQLADVLKHMDSDQARLIALKLYAVKDLSEYKTVIRKYILKGTMWRYFWHTLLGPLSTVGNALGIISNAQDTTNDIIGPEVR